MELTPGAWLGEWLLEAEIGQGGFSRVFRARRGGEGEPVALKVACGPRGADALRAGGSDLEHPRIVRTLERRLEHDPPFVVLELVPGGSLRGALGPGRIAPEVALRIVADVAAALDHAHARGVLHLDVKPENVLLAHDGARLADFGGARLDDPGPLAHSLRLSEDRMAAGTRDYAAPELREGADGTERAIDRRADVYGLGVLAYEVLTGRLPLGLDRPSEVCPDLPAAVDVALAHALARAPGRRTLSAGALLAELTAALGPSAASGSSPGSSAGGTARARARPPAPVRRGPIPLLLGVWAVVGVCSLAALSPRSVEPAAQVSLERVVEHAVRGRRPLALGVDDIGGAPGDAGLVRDLLASAERSGGVASPADDAAAGAPVESAALFTRTGRDALVRRADVGLHVVVTGEGPQGWLFEVDLATADLVAATPLPSAGRIDGLLVTLPSPPPPQAPRGPDDPPLAWGPLVPGSLEASAAQVGRLLALLLTARTDARPLAVLPAVDAASGASNRTTAAFDAHLTAALVSAPGRRAPVRARFGLVERLREAGAAARRATPAADADLRALLGVALVVESRLDAARGAVDVTLRDLERGEVAWSGSAPLDLRGYDPGQDAARLSVDPAAVERLVTERLDRLWHDHVAREVARACASAEKLLGDGHPTDARDLLDALRARGSIWQSSVETDLLRARAWVALSDLDRAADILAEASARAPDDPRPGEALAALSLGEARRLFAAGKRPWYRDDDEEAFRAARAWLDRLDAAHLSAVREAEVDRLRKVIDEEL